jgi:predicted metal-dependent hydrolase
MSLSSVDTLSYDEGMIGSAEVPVRPMQFERWVADLPKYFAADGDVVMSHVLAVLSSTFPEGEKFFVRSVAAVRDELTDPTLLKDVEGFIGQEKMHGREHQVLNDRLAEHGYPTRGIDAYVRGLYWVRERMQTKKVNLAFTAALEHYTATLAETLLSDPDARAQIGHPAVRSLLLWHALEEAEHKAVAFDVYKAVGGGEFTRIFVMFLTDLLFIFETSVMGVISMAKDREVRRHPGKLLRSLARLPASPFVSLRAVRMLAQYHRPGFHPNDRDTRDLIAEWREALFGRDGNLSQLLAG